MAQAVEALCAEMGVQCSRSELNSILPRCIRLDIEARGVGVGVEFDGDSYLDRSGKFCLAWHTLSGSSVKLSPRFGWVARASVNPHHFGKCTAFAYGFDDLLSQLRDCLLCIQSGAAFQEE